MAVIVEVYVPIRTESVANLRENWSKKAKRVKAEREAVAVLLRPKLRGKWMLALPCLVRLIRIAPRDLDSDGLVRSFKAVRDQVASELGVDDRDSRVEWRCFQQRGKPKEYGVRIVIEAA